MSEKRSLNGQVVAITGGAQGIGREIAAEFTAAGAKVAIGDIHLDAAQETAAELGVSAYRLDVSDPECLNAFLTEVTHELGPIDIFVSNAGIMWVGPFAEESNAVARAQIEVNLLGVINGIKAAAPAMVARGGGHLITVASAGSILPTPGRRPMRPRSTACSATSKPFARNCAARACGSPRSCPGSSIRHWRQGPRVVRRSCSPRRGGPQCSQIRTPTPVRDHRARFHRPGRQGGQSAAAGDPRPTLRGDGA